jgi:hypothetical protein
MAEGTNGGPRVGEPFRIPHSAFSANAPLDQKELQIFQQ